MTKPSAQPTERPPIVVVMGHVDHGKSTLLDFIRKSNVVATEHGGITQHVAAYEVEHNGRRITFIDTPGHAAFSASRARGAGVADIAILVVAADDGVKAQTLEALSQIQEAKIPFIVAINKIDKPNANLERTQASLMEKGVYLEKLGGDISWTAISAKNGTGIDELLDIILLTADVQEYRADPNVPAKGVVVEAHRDQKRGLAATLIIKEGTLKSGMALLAGSGIAPVRIMENHLGKSIKEATFSSPITLVGFDELPGVGEVFMSFKNKRDAEMARAAMAPRTAAEIVAATEGQYFMPLIVRADTTGTLQAILSEVARLGDEHARISIVQSGIGNISEGDIKTALAGSVHAVVVGFNVSIDGIADALARERGVRTEQFNIIYKLTEKLQELLKETAPKRTVEEVVGKAKLLKVFSSRKESHVVGGAVSEGYLARKALVRVTRRGVVVGEGTLINIQTNKQNVDRAEAPVEFGAQLDAPFEPAQGDTIECIVKKQV